MDTKKAFYFNKKLSIKKITLKQLKLKLDKKFKRVCFHNNISDPHQEMLISQKKLSYYPPKKNILTDQTFLIIEGKLMILIFDSRGKILEKVILSKKDNYLCRVKKNTYHCDVPLSNNTIHFESNNHAFKKRKIQFLKKKYLKNFHKFLKTYQ